MVLAAPPPYTLQATRACLLARPDAVAGLPPAQSPASIVFVYRLRNRDRRLGAWNGPTGVILSFFASVADARAAQAGATRVRNVVVTSDQTRALSPRVRSLVLDCLRTRARAVTPRVTPRATLATFAGAWGGHTRRLGIDAHGRGRESTDDGCCHRVEEMTFRIVSVRGTLTHATAVYRVTSFRRFVRDIPLSRVGQVGRLLLRNGVLTNTLTTVYFCSNPAWGATGICGA